MQNPEKELPCLLSICADKSKNEEHNQELQRMYVPSASWQNVNWIASSRNQIQAVHQKMCKFGPSVYLKFFETHFEERDQTCTVRYTKHIAPVTLPIIGLFSTGLVMNVLQCSSHLHSYVPETAEGATPRAPLHLVHENDELRCENETVNCNRLCARASFVKSLNLLRKRRVDVEINRTCIGILLLGPSCLMLCPDAVFDGVLSILYLYPFNWRNHVEEV